MDEESEDDKIVLQVDEILTRVGEFGRFQKAVDGVFCFAHLMLSYQILIMYFVTLTPSWRCVKNSTECSFNGTLLGEDTRRCDIPRNHWYYTEQKHFSLVTQFDIHCDKKWLLSMANSVHFIGWGVGAIILGYAGDRYGRKTLLLPSTVIVLTIGLVISFLPNIHYIILCRFVVGFFLPGVMMQANILISEIVGGKHRPQATLIPFFLFPIGYSVLALKAYFLQSWKMLSIVCSAPYFVILLLYPIIPESAKWLQMHNRLDDAINVYRTIGKWNKKVLESNIVINSPQVAIVSPSETSAKGKLIFLTLIQCYMWLISTMSFFGLQLAAKELKGPIYSNFALLSMVQAPAIIVSIVTCRKFGRKKANLTPLFFAGLSCLAIAIIPAEEKFIIIRVTIGIVGKFFASVAFQGLYVWTNEIFPTHFRSSGMGIVQVAARIGATSSTWVVKGLTPFGAWIPFVVLGIPSLIGTILGMWLPETYVKEIKVPHHPIKDAETGIDNKGNDIEMKSVE